MTPISERIGRFRVRSPLGKGRMGTLVLAWDPELERDVAIKLLFRPGSTEFWPSPELSGMYPMWLRQIAGAVEASGNCLEVLGHTSRSGSEALNDRLSLARAEAVQGLLEEHATGDLAGQLSARGMGFQNNIIGTGADDASDAIDRRVEFNVVPCEREGAAAGVVRSSTQRG